MQTIVQMVKEASKFEKLLRAGKLGRDSLYRLKKKHYIFTDNAAKLQQQLNTPSMLNEMRHVNPARQAYARSQMSSIDQLRAGLSDRMLARNASYQRGINANPGRLGLGIAPSNTGKPMAGAWSGSAGGHYSPSKNKVFVSKDNTWINGKMPEGIKPVRRHEVGHAMFTAKPIEAQVDDLTKLYTRLGVNRDTRKYLLSPVGSREGIIAPTNLEEAAGHFSGVKNFGRSRRAQNLVAATAKGIDPNVAKNMPAHLTNAAEVSTWQHMARNYGMGTGGGVRMSPHYGGAATKRLASQPVARAKPQQAVRNPAIAQPVAQQPSAQIASQPVRRPTMGTTGNIGANWANYAIPGIHGLAALNQGTRER